MTRKTANSGALFKNRYRPQPSSPPITGVLELSEESANELARRIANGERAIVKLEAWLNKTRKTGEEFLILKARLPVVEQHARLPIDEDVKEDPSTS